MHRSDLRALTAFLADYPEGQAALLYRGPRRLLIDDVLCLPVDAFLRGIVPNRPLLESVSSD